MKAETRNIWVIAAGYLVFLLLFLSHFGFNPSATINLGEKHLENYAGTVPSGLVIHHNDGFDGQYYYFMALSPSFADVRGIAPNFLQRIFYPFAAIALSLGYAPLFPIMLLLINFACAIVSSLMLMWLLRKYGSNQNWVMAWAFSVGILISLSCNLTELMMITWTIAAIYFLEKDRIWLSVLALACAFMTRESALTLGVGFVFYFLMRLRFWRAIQYALSFIPYLLWEMYFSHRFGTVPFFRTSQAVSMPNLFAASDSAAPGFVNTAFDNVSGLKSISGALQPSAMETLSHIYRTLSPWPIIAFILIIACIAIWNFFKEKGMAKKFSLYTVLLFSQLAFMVIINPKIMMTEGGEATGRYALGLYTISFLYYAERGKKYSKILAFLLIASAAAYIFQRAIVPKESYHISSAAGQTVLMNE